MERDYYVFVIELLFGDEVSTKGLCESLVISEWRGRIRECLDEMLNGSGGNIREVTLSHVAGDIFVEMRRPVFYSRAS